MKIAHKKVELTELFYDLVFVFAISKVTGLIHHVEEARDFLGNFALFTVVMIVFLNTWMVQTVFTNRYGRNSIKDMLFFMVDMAILLFMSNSFSGAISTWFRPFTLATGALSFTLLLQYLSVYLTTKEASDKKIASRFILILAIRTLGLVIGAFLPLQSGIVVALLGIIVSWLLPATFTKTMHTHPINFPHLLERLTLITIITFGETIVDIAPYFTQKTFALTSFLIFAIVCLLFLNYTTQFDHFIEEKREDETGVLLIYLHYFILFGISLVTVSLSFIGEEHFDKRSAVLYLYIGLALFYLGILIATRYNKAHLKISNKIILLFVVILACGFFSSYFIASFDVIVWSTFGVTLIIAFSYIHYLSLKNSR